MATNLVYEDFPGNSTTYPVNFEYLKPSCVYVAVKTTEEFEPVTTGWSLTDPTTVTFDSAPGGTVRIYRTTPVDEPVATFFPSVAIRAVDLNNNFDQALMRLQEINVDLTAIDTEFDELKEEVDALNELVAELSGIEIVADVAAFNAFTPTAVGGAIQVSDSTDWSAAQNVTDTPAGFTGGPDLRVNVRVTATDPKAYDFISYTAVDPDARYVEKTGSIMTGELVLFGDPTTDKSAATKQYVDNAVTSDSNTTYDFGAASDGSNAQLQLVGSDGTTDAVTITPGSNITITDQTSVGFTINAAGSAIPGTGNVTIAAGTNMTGGGSFNVNQSEDITITLNSTASGTGSTNLSWTNVTTSTGEVASDTGTNATLTSATAGAAGLMSSADKTAFDAIPSVYLTQTAASTTYLTQTDASTTYLTQTAAASTYVKADFSSYPEA